MPNQKSGARTTRNSLDIFRLIQQKMISSATVPLLSCATRCPPRARRRTALAFTIVASAFLTACGSDGGPSTPDTTPVVLSVSAGSSQTAVVGQAVSVAPAVRITRSGNPVSGIVVTFAATLGGGSVTGGTVTSNSSGIASATSWTLGTTAGANTVTATVADQTVTSVVFTASGTAAAASAASKQTGDAQTGIVGQAVATRPAVKVVDQFGNAVAGVTVTFAVTGAAGTITGATQTSGADGIATVGGWTLGNTVGAQTLTATVAGVAGVSTFTATARAGAASAVVKSAGDAQTATAGSPIAIPIAVKLTDSFGNGIAGVSVLFAVTQGAGTITGATQSTGADGVATLPTWTLGTLAGGNTVTATATGAGLTGNPASFTAVGIAGPAALLQRASVDSQTAVVGSAVAVPPSVRLLDQYGNGITGRTVSFSLTTGAGILTGASPVTNTSGIATIAGWTLGPTAGLNTTTAAVGSLNIVFSATALNALNAPLYAGTYTGSWTNTTFGTTDVGTAIIAVNSTTNTVSVTGSAGGAVLGGGPVAATTRSTTYSPTSGAFTGNVPQMGNITGSVTASNIAGTANIEATGTSVPNAAISKWTMTGTITATQLRMSFVVTFTSGSTAVGTISLNKPA